MRYITVTVALLLYGAPAFAWNALGHKLIAELAWQGIEPIQRVQIVDELRRHPRFGEDFINGMPADVASADKATQDHWFFQHAATWPDITRNIRGDARQFDRPTWHYINIPLLVDRQPPLMLNTSMEYPSMMEFNIAQASKHSLAVLKQSRSAPERALAYCWLFHLVGDMHQPMHSTAIFSDYFPKGDRGGNDIPLARGRNLHAMWDNLLGRQSRMQDVQREVAQLQSAIGDWQVHNGNIDTWIAESHNLAKTFAYDPLILHAVSAAQPGTDLRPVVLPESYMREAGRLARQRVYAAGNRLAELLKAN